MSEDSSTHRPDYESIIRMVVRHAMHDGVTLTDGDAVRIVRGAYAEAAEEAARWLYGRGEPPGDPVHHERHTEEVGFRLSSRLRQALDQLAEREETSVSEVVREALAVRWGLK